MVALAAEHGVAAGPAGRQHVDGRRRDAAGGRVGADPFPAPDEPDPRRSTAERCAPWPRPGWCCRRCTRRSLEQGLRFPLTLGAKGSATIGGLISTNAGGTQVLRFGPMRGAGRRDRGGAARRHDPRRPVRPQEGQSRLQPRPAADRRRRDAGDRHRGPAEAVSRPSIRAPWPGLGWPVPQAALDTLRALQAATDRIEGFEILPQELLERGRSAIFPGPARRSTARHRLACAGRSDGRQSPMQSRRRSCWPGCLRPLIERGLVENAAISASEAQAEAFWRIRDSLSEAERATFGPATQHDIRVPVEAMPRFMAEAAAEVETALSRVPRLRLRPSRRRQYPFPRPRRGARRAGLAASARARRCRGWSTTWSPPRAARSRAEHGIGQMKKDELERLAPDRVRHLRAIKAALDPKGLMNPGKLI